MDLSSLAFKASSSVRRLENKALITDYINSPNQNKMTQIPKIISDFVKLTIWQRKITIAVSPEQSQGKRHVEMLGASQNHSRKDIRNMWKTKHHSLNP